MEIFRRIWLCRRSADSGSSTGFPAECIRGNSIGPIVAAMSIVVVFTILSEMNIPIYDKTIRPYLFTTHMVAWKGFFYVKSTEEGITINGSVGNLPAILKSLSVLVIYIASFLAAAIWVFRKKRHFKLINLRE